LTFQNHTDCPLTDFGGKTSIFSHPVYLFLRKFSLQDSRGGSKELASACRERNEMAEVKRVRENERNKIREKQLQALNDAHSVKER
ncbi:hypothetical protein, partial [Escherichia coli]|uniref:hypothetical protein n=1 Tax=Escherichia coli TaxID=562 RepID=UPI001BE5570F